MRGRADLLACLAIVGLGVAWRAGPLLGLTAIGPDVELDTDPVFRSGPSPPRAEWDDATPIVLDYPRDLELARGLREGRLDQWNPLVACGAPLWAEQGGPFFPLKAPFYLVPSPQGYAAFLILRVIAAALGAYVLARMRGLAPTVALFAAALYEISGAQAAQFPFGSLSAICVVPWAVVGAYDIARSRRVVPAALALGVAGHGGHPTILLLVFLGFGATLAGHALVARRPMLLARGAVAAALGILLCAPVLLPFLELLREGAPYKLTAVGELNWQANLVKNRASLPIALYAPGLIDLLRHQNKWLYPNPFGPTLGVGGVVLALAGLLAGVLEMPLLVLLGLGVALALAPPPLRWILPHLPGVGSLSPTYAWSLFVLPLTQAAAGALPLLGAAAARRRYLIALATVPLGILAVFLLPDDAIDRVPIRAYLHRVLAGAPGTLWLAVPPFVLGAGALAAFRSRRPGAILGTLAFVELLVLTGRLGFDPRSRVLAAPPSPTVAFLRETLGRDYRLHALPFRTARPASGMLFGLRDLRQNSPLPLQRFADYLAAIRKPGFFFIEHTADAASSPLLDQAAVRAVAVDPLTPSVDVVRGRVPANDGAAQVFLNDAALPRARVARRSVPVASSTEAAARLPEVDGDTVLLEPAPAAAEALDGGGKARIVDDRPDHVVVRAELERPGYVVLADSFYPGWEATVDGLPTAIHPANVLFRAVRVDAGVHDIVFVYRPVWFRVGLGAAFVGVVVCTLLWRRRR